MKVKYWWQLSHWNLYSKPFINLVKMLLFHLSKVVAKNISISKALENGIKYLENRTASCTLFCSSWCWLFVMHRHISFGEGILLKHCIPACLFGIYPPSLGIKSCPQGETGCFFADWCSGWGCGGSTRQGRSLCGWWNTKRKRCLKSTGTGSEMCLYWKTNFMGPGLQGE